MNTTDSVPLSTNDGVHCETLSVGKVIQLTTDIHLEYPTKTTLYTNDYLYISAIDGDILDVIVRRDAFAKNAIQNNKYPKKVFQEQPIQINLKDLKQEFIVLSYGEERGDLLCDLDT